MCAHGALSGRGHTPASDTQPAPWFARLFSHAHDYSLSLWGPPALLGCKSPGDGGPGMSTPNPQAQHQGCICCLQSTLHGPRGGTPAPTAALPVPSFCFQEAKSHGSFLQAGGPGQRGQGGRRGGAEAPPAQGRGPLHLLSLHHHAALSTRSAGVSPGGECQAAGSRGPS